MMKKALLLISSLCLSFAMLSTAQAASLNQAAFNPASNSYVFGYRSIPNMAIANAPADTDWQRWAMLHDGATYRLYFFRQGSADTLYQFAFNPATSRYEYGFNSIPQLSIVGMPADADSSRFAMLHDGSAYRLYLRKQNAPGVLYQAAFNRATNQYEFGYNSINVLNVAGMPADTDWNRFAMLFDGKDYRFYAMKAGSPNTFYQAAFNREQNNQYIYGYRSIPVLQVQGMPGSSDTSDFAMLHDRQDYRFYFLNH